MADGINEASMHGNNSKCATTNPQWFLHSAISKTDYKIGRSRLGQRILYSVPGPAYAADGQRVVGAGCRCGQRNLGRVPEVSSNNYVKDTRQYN